MVRPHGGPQSIGVGEIRSGPREAHRGEHSRDESERAAVGIVAEHDVVARRQRAQQCVLGRHARGEGQAVGGTLQRRKALLERLAGRVVGSGVLIAPVDPGLFLHEGRGERDRCHDCAAGGVVTLTGPDRTSLEAEHLGIGEKVIGHRSGSLGVEEVEDIGRGDDRTGAAAIEHEHCRARLGISTARATGWPAPMVGNGAAMTSSTVLSSTASVSKASSIRRNSETEPAISAAASGISPLPTGNCDTPLSRMIATASLTFWWGCT